MDLQLQRSTLWEAKRAKSQGLGAVPSFSDECSATNGRLFRRVRLRNGDPLSYGTPHPTGRRQLEEVEDAFR